MDAVEVSARRTTAAVVALVLLVACRGPSPVVTAQQVLPGAADAPMLVEATVENRGGEGQVSLEAVVRERGSQAIVARASRDVELERGGVQRVVLELPESGLRAGIARGDLELAVTASYPIQ
jgi:hypothetical protein